MNAFHRLNSSHESTSWPLRHIIGIKATNNREVCCECDHHQPAQKDTLDINIIAVIDRIIYI